MVRDYPNVFSMAQYNELGEVKEKLYEWRHSTEKHADEIWREVISVEKKIDTKRIQKLFSDCSDSGADLRGGGWYGGILYSLVGALGKSIWSS